MKTKVRPIYVIVFLLAGGVLVWLASLVPSGQHPDPFPVTLDGTGDKPAELAPAEPGWAEPERADAAPRETAAGSSRIHDLPEGPPPEIYFRELRKAYSHPIEFYGKVVDQDENPVPGAEVNFTWATPPPNEYGNKASTQSDADGRFELKNAVGRTLTVRVAKSGYYFPDGQRISFRYAPEDGNFKADPKNPVIYRLRKRGPGVELVTSQYGVNSHLGISAPTNGTPVWVDLFERKVGGGGQLRVSKLTPPRSPDGVPSVKEWRLTLSIPDGGFVEIVDDEFPFYPPETGYQPVLDFHYPTDRKDWVNRVSGQYYIAFGNPRRYGRIKFETAVTRGIRLEYVVNPDGRPYLEPKEVVIE
ncbi:MAG TPA: hypothetical protein DCY13_08445 [Verrucomicrobiales bacterium]|nr:hypothetical protein [Verrucomicrobiales bacterium]